MQRLLLCAKLVLTLELVLPWLTCATNAKAKTFCVGAARDMSSAEQEVQLHQGIKASKQLS